MNRIKYRKKTLCQAKGPTYIEVAPAKGSFSSAEGAGRTLWPCIHCWKPRGQLSITGTLHNTFCESLISKSSDLSVLTTKSLLWINANLLFEVAIASLGKQQMEKDQNTCFPALSDDAANDSFYEMHFQKVILWLETNPICPVKGAPLQFLAWHGAAGGKKKPSSWKVKRRPHTGVGTCLAELRQPAGVGVTTAAFQIKQRAAHDSPGWMPPNTARHTSRSIHSVWHWKRYPEPWPILCLFSIRLLLL